MILTRKICEFGHSVRIEEKKLNKIKIRQPLLSFTLELPKNFSFKDSINIKVYEEIIKQELNVKNLIFQEFQQRENLKIGSFYGGFDTNLTPELIKEGELREFMRSVQIKRKEMGLKATDYVEFAIPEKFFKDALLIRKRLMIKNK